MPKDNSLEMECSDGPPTVEELQKEVRELAKAL
jgi:hypothetical protein